MSKINIFVARHGETIFNKKEYIQGQSDAPLTVNGHQGAVDLGKELQDIEFCVAVSSNLRRAVTTRDIILDHNKNKETPRLIDPQFGEYNFGEYEGDSGINFWEKKSEKYGIDFSAMEKEDFLAKYDYLYHENDNPTAERAEDFKARLIKGMNEVIAEAKEKGHKNVLVVAHGIVVHGLIQLLDNSYAFNGIIQNSSVTKFTYENDKFQIQYVGQRTGEF